MNLKDYLLIPAPIVHLRCNDVFWYYHTPNQDTFIDLRTKKCIKLNLDFELPLSQQLNINTKKIQILDQTNDIIYDEERARHLHNTEYRKWGRCIYIKEGTHVKCTTREYLEKGAETIFALRQFITSGPRKFDTINVINIKYTKGKDDITTFIKKIQQTIQDEL